MEKSVFNKGFNYAIDPNTIYVAEIGANVELFFHCQDNCEAQLLGQDISRISRTDKPPKRNLAGEEKHAL